MNDLVGVIWVAHKPQELMRPDLLALFTFAELENYLAKAELTDHPNGSPGSRLTDRLIRS
jgi:hypothetical protein